MRSAQLQRLFGSDDWSVRSLKAEGDCFYLGIQMGITTECTVESLRSMVAEAVDEATWEMYQSIKYCCDDYEWVCSCCSIDEARRRVCMDVPTAKRNKVPCVWADDFAIQTIANTLRIAVLIYNSEAQTESSRCLSILPSYLSSEEVSELDNVEVVLLLRTRRSHYNLIEYVHTKTLLLDMIPFPRFLISAAVEIDHDESDSWHLELSTKLLNHTIVREHGRIRVSNSTYHRRLHNVVLFDGTCVLCDKSVDFVIQRDNRKHRGLPLFKAVAIQSEKGQQFIEDEKMNAAKINKLNTVVLAATDGRVYIESDAALRILLDCNYPWPILGRVGMLVPKFIRDPVYRFIAGHRYRWFGTKEMCGLPKPSDKESYL
jgi:predicted DCC family thiol-disulfide oxidoreductase YuxK